MTRKAFPQPDYAAPERRIPQNSLIIIPARMNSTRLPGKPLADIGGEPMIIRVAARAREAKLGKVLIATDHAEIKAAAAARGFEAVMTSPKHESGSDRIYEALQQIDPNGNFEIIINVQGDLPTIAPADIIAAAAPLQDKKVDIATLCAVISREEEKTNPDVVKLVGSARPASAEEAEDAAAEGRRPPQRLRALYFTRATAPYGEGPLYHHIGLYAYRRAALEQFVRLPPSPLERRERLEQLRALEADMRIDATIVDSVPLGVDSPADLERARLIWAREAAKSGSQS